MTSLIFCHECRRPKVFDRIKVMKNIVCRVPTINLNFKFILYISFISSSPWKINVWIYWLGELFLIFLWICHHIKTKQQADIYVFIYVCICSTLVEAFTKREIAHFLRLFYVYRHCFFLCSRIVLSMFSWQIYLAVRIILRKF